MDAEQIASTMPIDQEQQQYAPGELAATICPPDGVKVWKPDTKILASMPGESSDGLLDSEKIGILQSLAKSISTSDEAARRFQVLQTWEARHVDRGYQYLDADGTNGGWTIAGTSGYTSKNRNYIADADNEGLYATNVFSAQGDIATGCLQRGKIKVQFSPCYSKDPKSVTASETANQYKHLWEKNNPDLQKDCADLSWTESRVLVWTRTIADRKFGLDEQGLPRKRQVSTPYGVLESKLPMMVDKLSQSGYAAIWEEVDYAEARAAYWWMGDRIKPSWGTYGELEFERIARINTRIGIIGKYITGTSGIREATMGYLWFRPGMYYDDLVPQAGREWLLKEFPSGLFVVFSGNDVCCCWEESMDDHLALGMFARGFGQNRRSLGSSDLPIQKRINIWADLLDTHFRSDIPVTGLDVEVWNVEAISRMNATPQRFTPVARPENGDLQGSVVQTPVAQPTPGHLEMFQLYIGPLLQSIDGCTPALFGGGEGEDNTVGATQIRLNQSLERFGPPWQMLNCLMASACLQAAKDCAHHAGDALQANIKGYGDISVDPKDLCGNIECEPETAGVIPESGAQREAKISEMLLAASTNAEIAAVVGKPSNAREIVKGLRLDDVITVDEANWEDCALEDIENLLENDPLDNPDWIELDSQVEELKQQHEKAKAAATQQASTIDLSDPDQIEQVAGPGEQLAQQLEQLQEQFAKTPRYKPSINVAQDSSQDHATIAATVFSWMGEPEGRNLRRKADRQKEGTPGSDWAHWTNVYLYWQAHSEMAGKFSQAQAPPPRVSLTGKLSPEQQAQILLMNAGIQTDPKSLQAHELEQETRIYTPIGEQVQKVKRRL